MVGALVLRRPKRGVDRRELPPHNCVHAPTILVAGNHRLDRLHPAQGKLHHGRVHILLYGEHQIKVVAHRSLPAVHQRPSIAKQANSLGHSETSFRVRLDHLQLLGRVGGPIVPLVRSIRVDPADRHIHRRDAGCQQPAQVSGKTHRDSPCFKRDFGGAGEEETPLRHTRGRAVTRQGQQRYAGLLDKTPHHLIHGQAAGPSLRVPEVLAGCAAIQMRREVSMHALAKHVLADPVLYHPDHRAGLAIRNLVEEFIDFRRRLRARLDGARCPA